ncbi:hypothetical protein [Pseudonocardia xinjiangensis]|uniref:hypothetical protein n=1 Tax=Pseudonocardia xinjiangensis TaxID=75289 RepID=UPI001B7CF6C7|nr:hypothetical protein [Pseudonocardia xinjiangensis]
MVTAQIHDAEDDVLEVRLEGERLVAQYEDGDGERVIDPAYRLGTPYDLRIVAAGSRVQVFCNGELKADIPSARWSSTRCRRPTPGEVQPRFPGGPTVRGRPTSPDGAVPESFPVVDVVNRAVASGHRNQRLSVMAPLVECDLCICRGT